MPCTTLATTATVRLGPVGRHTADSGHWAEEAIPERDPAYELPDDDRDTSAPVAWTDSDRATWQLLCRIRPLLACIQD
jgi:hypothetical protein